VALVKVVVIVREFVGELLVLHERVGVIDTQLPLVQVTGPFEN
jgi:hypothetical protein